MVSPRNWRVLLVLPLGLLVPLVVVVLVVFGQCRVNAWRHQPHMAADSAVAFAELAFVQGDVDGAYVQVLPALAAEVSAQQAGEIIEGTQMGVRIPLKRSSTSRHLATRGCSSSLKVAAAMPGSTTASRWRGLHRLAIRWLASGEVVPVHIRTQRTVPCFRGAKTSERLPAARGLSVR